MPAKHVIDGWDGDACNPHAATGVVLGSYLVTTQTPGMSALQLQRQLGLSRYETAFQMLHKLRVGMVRPDQDRIGAQWPIEMDEALVGGQTRGEGKGVHHMTYVVGAVEVRPKQDKRGGCQDSCRIKFVAQAASCVG